MSIKTELATIKAELQKCSDILGAQYRAIDAIERMLQPEDKSGLTTSQAIGQLHSILSYIYAFNEQGGPGSRRAVRELCQKAGVE